MANPSYRFEDLTPDQLKSARSVLESIALDGVAGNPDFLLDKQTFNGLPESERKKLFDVLSAGGTPPIPSRRIPPGGIPPLPASLVPVEDDSSLMGIIRDPFRENIPPLPSNLIPLEPTIGEKATAIGTGVAEGIVRYSAPTAAAGYAFTSAAPLAVTPVIGPAIPFLAGAGAFAGTYLLGDIVADAAFPSPNREEVVPYFEGGKTAGGIFGGAPWRLLATAPSAVYVTNRVGERIYKFIDNSRRIAIENPKTFLGREALTATAAGAAGGAAEAYAPGEGGVRFASELGASIFTPGKLLLTGVSVGSNALRGVIGKESIDNSRANKLYRILDGVLRESEPIKQLEELGTPDSLRQASFLRDRYYTNIIRQLETNFPSEVKPTAALATGDPGLSILELSLAKGDASFAARVSDQSVKAMRAQQSLIEALRSIGDPAALKAAAELQAKNFDDMVLGRIGIAERKAADAISKISNDNPASRRLIGDVIKRNVEDALSEARDYEKRLWNEAFQQSMRVQKGQLVPRTVVPRQTLISFLDTVANMTPERYQAIPSEIRSIMGRLGVSDASIASYQRGMRTPEYLQTGQVPVEYLIGGTRVGRGGKLIFEPLGKKTSVDELIRVRGDLLGWARDAASSTGQRSPSDARLFGKLAEAVLDDFSQLNTAAYDRARAFSRSLNDNFTRSYARDITAVNKAGAERVPAELVVGRIFGRDSDLTFFRMEQVEDAVGLFSKQYTDLQNQLAQLRASRASPSRIGAVAKQLEDLKPLAELANKRVVSTTDAMERVLRIALTDPSIINRETGKVNATALSNWMTRNQQILNKFGSLKNDLNNVVDAENALSLLNAPNSAAARQLRDQEAFSAVLAGGEKPTAAVSDILASRTPTADLRKLIEVVNKSGVNKPSALNGLKSAIYEWAYTKSGGTGNTFSVQAFQDNLFNPLAPGQPSIINLMRTQGLMSSDEVKNLLRLFAPMRRMEESIANKSYVENVIAGNTPIDDFAVRFMALHLGSKAIPSGPGSLAAASAVSQTAQRIFNQMPRLNALVALKEAAENPKLMAALLKKGRTDQEKMKFLQDLQDQFSAVGLIATPAQRAVIPALNVSPQGQQDTQRLREEARRNRMAPAAIPPARGMPGMGAPPARSPPAASTQSRVMLQQLFPNDAISGAAALQGMMPQAG